MSDEFERRKFKRCDAKLLSELKSDGESIKTHTSDVSMGGICIHSDKPVPIKSKVYVTLVIPKEKEQDIEEIKVIGEVMRVEEVATESGATTSLGIKFDNISRENLSLLKDFLKEKYSNNKDIAEPPPQTTEPEVESEEDDEDIDKDEIEVQGLETVITPIDTSDMSFWERLTLREDYSDIFIKSIKWALKGGLFLVALYILYYLTKLIIKLINLS